MRIKIVGTLLSIMVSVFMLSAQQTDTEFRNAVGKNPSWMLNTFVKGPDGRASGIFRIEKDENGKNVLIFSVPERFQAALCSRVLEPATAGETFHAEALVSGRGRFLISFYSYTDQKKYLTTAKTEYIRLGTEPEKKKFKIPVINWKNRKTAFIRVMIMLTPDTELKLSDLKISLIQN